MNEIIEHVSSTLSIDHPVKGMICFDTPSLADKSKINELLKKICERRNCYVIHTSDYWDWDYGGKDQSILNPDEEVKDITPYHVWGHVFHEYCIIDKNDALKYIEEYRRRKKREEEIKNAMKELENAVTYKITKVVVEDYPEEGFQFNWNEDKVRKIVQKYNLSDEEIEELKRKIESRIMDKYMWSPVAY